MFRLESLKSPFLAEDDGKVDTALCLLKDMFVTILEFEKLERLEFGGSKGAVLNAQIHSMKEEFIECCNVFRQSIYDPSDCDSMVVSCILFFYLVESYPFKAKGR